ncbi:MAG: hypothetical protein ACPGGK_09825 [Pikeienuella sp.]
MRLLAGIALSFAVATPLIAEEPMGGDQFDDLSTGWTLYFEDDSGAYFGAEQYLGNGRTVWRSRNSGCQWGEWYEADNQICFLYKGQRPSCWHLYSEGEGMRAESTDQNAEDRLTLRMINRDRRSLNCEEGPAV